jgi:predicted ATPase
MATITLGWSLVEQGSHDEGIELMRRGIAAHEQTGTQIARPHFLALLAEALGRAGRADEGLRLFNDAMELAQQNGERCYLAELYRVKGELELMRGSQRVLSQAATGGKGKLKTEGSVEAEREAETCFAESIRIAQQQKAKSWELRATVSLARLYRDGGKQKKARSLLAPIYASLTEGFDTLDVREAKALLGDGS